MQTTTAQLTGIARIENSVESQTQHNIRPTVWRSLTLKEGYG